MKSIVQPVRKRLAPPWLVVSLGAGMVLLMLVMFPRASLFLQLGRSNSDAQADSLRVLLLRNLLLKGEKGIDLRKDYIRQLGLTGDYRGSFEELDRLLPGTPGDPQSDSLRMLEVEVCRWALAAHPADSLVRRRLVTGLRAISVSQSNSVPLVWAAEKADATGEYALALAIYQRLAQEGGSQSVQWYRQAARLAASLGDCRQASDVHFQILGKSRDREERKNAYLDGLRALEACDKLDLAISEADRRLGDFRNDPQVLLFLVNLARSANRPREAEKYALMLVKPETTVARTRR